MPEWKMHSEDTEVECSVPIDNNFAFELENSGEKRNLLNFGELVLINNGAEWEERNIERALYQIETEEMSGKDLSEAYLKFQAFTRTERKSDGWRDYELESYIIKVKTLKDLSKRLGLPKERFHEWERFNVHIAYNPRTGKSVAGIRD